MTLVCRFAHLEKIESDGWQGAPQEMMCFAAMSRRFTKNEA